MRRQAKATIMRGRAAWDYSLLTAGKTVIFRNIGIGVNGSTPGSAVQVRIIRVGQTRGYWFESNMLLKLQVKCSKPDSGATTIKATSG